MDIDSLAAAQSALDSAQNIVERGMRSMEKLLAHARQLENMIPDGIATDAIRAMQHVLYAKFQGELQDIREAFQRLSPTAATDLGARVAVVPKT